MLVLFSDSRASLLAKGRCVFARVWSVSLLLPRCVTYLQQAGSEGLGPWVVLRLKELVQEGFKNIALTRMGTPLGILLKCRF